MKKKILTFSSWQFLVADGKRKFWLKFALQRLSHRDKFFKIYLLEIWKILRSFNQDMKF